MATPGLGGGSLTAQDVLDYAERISRNRVDVGVNLCQRFVREAFGSAGGAATAVDAWRSTPDKHTAGSPPPGAAVYWGGGAGHAAISAGNGWVYTTDWSEPGKVDLARIDDITQKWGKPLLGWTGQTNERKILKFNAQPVEGLGQGGTSNPVYGATDAGGEPGGYSRKELRKRYGYIAEMYAGVPEIQKLVAAGVKAKWTPEEFDRRFQASKWYKNHSDSERKFVLDSSAQPGDLKDRIAKTRADVVNLYRNMGVPVGKARVEEIATNAIKHNWTQQQITNAVAAEFDYAPDKTFGGLAGSTVDELRQMSQQYLVPLSNQTLDKWTTNVLRGEADPKSFEAYLKAQATSLFPELADSIERGVTVADYLDPYREVASQMLDVSPDDIDWFDPKWSQAVFQTDPTTNARTVMGLADWQKTLRTDSKYGFAKTTTARGTAAQFADQLATMMAGA